MSIEIRHGDKAELAAVADLVWRRVSPEAEPEPPDDAFAVWFAGWVAEHAQTHVPFVGTAQG